MKSDDSDSTVFSWCALPDHKCQAGYIGFEWHLANIGRACYNIIA